MRRSLLLIAASALFASKSVSGDTAPPRIDSFCGYVGGRIYCWSGDTSRTTVLAIDPNIYSLDVNSFIGQKTDDLSTKWEKIVPSTPFDTEPRELFNAIVLPDKKRILINGGRTSKKLTNQTIIYDTTTNSWEKSILYADPVRGVRQIQAAAVVNMPNGFAGFYGGLEQFANITVPQTTDLGPNMPFDGANSSAVGFKTIKAFSPDSPEPKRWLTPSPQLAPPSNFFPNAQTAVLNPDSGKVYYIGGSYYAPDAPTTEKKISFRWAHTFDTKTGIWFNQTLGGIEPTQRDYHTTILMPNSPDILLYGGTVDYTKASLDYCSTLNLNNNEWTPHKDLKFPDPFSGPRFLHNSVLVNTTLYILFGKNLNGDLTPSILTIDVTSVSNISYVDTVIAPVISVTPDSKNGTIPTNPEQSPPQPKGLGQGAIGGIAGGAAAVVLAIVTFLYFRNKKAKERKAYDHNEQISVDWDKIDDQYKEVHLSSPHIPNTPYYSSEGSTRVGNTSPEDSSGLYVQQSPRLVGTQFVGGRMLHGQQGQFGAASYGDVPHSSTDLDSLKPSNDNKDIGHNLVKPDIA